MAILGLHRHCKTKLGYGQKQGFEEMAKQLFQLKVLLPFHII